jgi:hypothetical protein
MTTTHDDSNNDDDGDNGRIGDKKEAKKQVSKR